jgi:inositol oxygenase
MLEWVRKFNPYDLYSKSDSRPEMKDHQSFYNDLIAEFFPGPLSW